MSRNITRKRYWEESKHTDEFESIPECVNRFVQANLIQAGPEYNMTRNVILFYYRMGVQTGLTGHSLCDFAIQQAIIYLQKYNSRYNQQPVLPPRTY